jgi:hypothetical protein
MTAPGTAYRATTTSDDNELLIINGTPSKCLRS